MPTQSKIEAESLGAFPTATLVVGVGEMGRQVLELLGERWSWIADDNPNDPTLHHLRLLQLTPDASNLWRSAETNERILAENEGDSAEPDHVLDFLILRTLGLVRYQNGAWELGCPQDHGPIALAPNGLHLTGSDEIAVDSDSLTPLGWRRLALAMRNFVELPPIVQRALSDEQAAALSDIETNRSAANAGASGGDKDAAISMHRPSNGLFAGHTTFRLRSYRWALLSEDPRDAAQRLHKILRLDGEIARFIEPLLARVRDGNSPRILLHALYRSNSWAKGADPSPWASPSMDEDDAKIALHDVLEEYDRIIFGERFGVTQNALKPQFFDRDVSPNILTPLHPWTLLSLNWETPGWTFHDDSLEQRLFRALPGSPQAFGFADTDARLDPDHQKSAHLRFDEKGWYEHLSTRIAALNADARKGFIRLWGHLTRLRQRQTENNGSATNRSETLHQSLELLGQFLIRDTLNAGLTKESSYHSNTQAQRGRLPLEKWERALDSGETRRSSAADAFDERLREMGIEFPRASEKFRFATEAELSLRTSVASDLKPNSEADPELSDATIVAFRAWLNRNARELLSSTRLSALPRPPGEKRLEIRVYIVGDLGEVETRVAIRPLLRFAHAELLRLISPIYENSFDGHTRPLTITPILSFPHPADASGAEHEDSPEIQAFDERQRRVDERLIIDAVHGLRRWIELVPLGEQLTHEILVNGRVTDRAILAPEDAAEEIRAFIWMNARNTLSNDPLLSRAMHNRTDDVLATFSCRELSFPGERARTWTANRFARALLHAFQSPKPSEVGDSSPLKIPAVSASDATEAFWRTAQKNTEALSKDFTAITKEICDSLETATAVQASDNAADILRDKIDDKSIRAIVDDRIVHHWASWASEQRQMDAFAAGFVDLTHAQSSSLLNKYERRTQYLVEQTCPKEGSRKTREAIDETKKAAGKEIRDVHLELQGLESKVAVHRNPAPGRIIKPALEELRQSVKDKPDQVPLYIGAILVACSLSFLLGPGILSAIQNSEWMRSNFSTTKLSTGPLLLSEIFVVVLFCFLFAAAARWWMQRRLDAISKAREALKVKVGEAIVGDSTDALQPYFTKRLKYQGALANYSVQQRLLVRVSDDARLLHRIDRAASARLQLLRAEIEEAGVLCTASDSALEGMSFDRDNIEYLFSQLEDREWLAPPASLARWYAEQVSGGSTYTREVSGSIVEAVESPELLRAVLSSYFKKHPLSAHWRKQAPFADATFEEFCHNMGAFVDSETRHQNLPDWSILLGGNLFREEESIREKATETIMDYTGRCFGTIGFGAKFRGREGMDDDGIASHSMLLVNSKLREEIEFVLKEKAKDTYADGSPRQSFRQNYKTLFEKGQIEIPRLRTELQTNSVYFLMTALGIRERSFQNLRRFTTFHDRHRLPEREQFPLSLSGARMQISDAPMHYFSHLRLHESEGTGAYSADSEAVGGDR